MFFMTLRQHKKIKFLFMENQGITIRKLRERFGYGRDAVANFLNVKRDMISYYEAGTTEIPLGAVGKIG